MLDGAFSLGKACLTDLFVLEALQDSSPFVFSQALISQFCLHACPELCQLLHMISSERAAAVILREAVHLNLSEKAQEVKPSRDLIHYGRQISSRIASYIPTLLRQDEDEEVETPPS